MKTVRNKMLSRKLVLSFAIVIAVISANSIGANDHLEIRQNFRKIGNLASGLSYAHVHTTVKFNRLKNAVNNVLHVIKMRREKTEFTRLGRTPENGESTK